jgi:glycosyltransferase 2 family protein
MTEDAPVPATRGTAWKVMLRLAVTAAFLALLASRAHGVEDVVPAEHHVLTIVLLAAAVVATLVGVVLSAWRWQSVLRVFGADVPLARLTRHYLASLFIGTVLPSTIGGDVLRVSRAADDVGSEVAFGSVVLERLTGFVALPLLVGIGFALDPSLANRKHGWIALLVAGITLTVLVLILLAAGHPKVAGRYANSSSWTRFIGAVHAGVNQLRREPRKAVPVLLTAMVYQLSVIAVFALVFRALDLDVPLVAVVAMVPAVLMIQVLPISISGLGVREGAIAFFLTSFDVTAQQALAAGLLWFGALVVVSMLGAPAFAVGRRGRHKSAERA